MRPLGAHFRSYGLVLWSAGGVFLWLVGCCMAAESLSDSWSAQVPERPAAEGSRLVYPRGCRGVDPCCASRRIPCCRRIGHFDAPLRPFAWFCFAGGSAADRTTVETSLTLRPFASKFPAAAYTRRFVSSSGTALTLRRFASKLPAAAYTRRFVSTLRGRASGAIYLSTGGVYPVIGSGFVVCWGCICAHWQCISAY